MMASIYQIYTEENQLLYVGCSLDIINRINSHKSTKLWWPEVSYIKIENIDNKKQAFDKEKKLISELRPIYNTRHLEKFLIQERNESYKPYLLERLNQEWSSFTAKESNIYYPSLCSLEEDGLIERTNMKFKQYFRLTQFAIQAITKNKLVADKED